jgi:hypothetical protein
MILSEGRASVFIRKERSGRRKRPATLRPARIDGGPGRVRTDDGISPADYESAACNQHGVRPTKLRSVATNETTNTAKQHQQKSPVYPKAGLFDDRPTYYTKAGRPGHRARHFRALKTNEAQFPSRNDLSLSERLGWRSLRSAFASIWRIRSRVTSNCLPTSSSV